MPPVRFAPRPLVVIGGQAADFEPTRREFTRFQRVKGVARRGEGAWRRARAVAICDIPGRMSEDATASLDPAERAGDRLLSPGRLLSRRSGDVMVLVDVQSGEVFELNVTAAKLFECLRAGQTVGEAAQELSRCFEVSEETVLADMAPFLQSLRDHGLLGG